MLSSTFTDLKEYRATVLKALENLQHIIQAMELFYAKHDRPLKVCIKEANESDIFICLVAWRYGTIDEDTGKSVTHLEYETAYNKGIPCLVFLLDDAVPWSAKYIDRGKKGKKLLEFRELLKKNHTCRYFKEPANLALDVVISLREYLPEFANDKLRRNGYWKKLDTVFKLRELYARPEFDTSYNDLEIIKMIENALKGLERIHELINNSYDQMMEDLKELLSKLRFNIKKLNIIPYHENPFFDRDWEIRILGMSNHVIYLRGGILQLKVRALEKEYISNPKNKKIELKLKKAKEQLKSYFEKTSLYD